MTAPDLKPGGPSLVAIWARRENKREIIQYALRANGEVIARVAEGPRRIGAWVERKTVPMPKGYKKLDEQLTNLGFELEFRDGRVGIGKFVGRSFREDPVNAPD